MNGTQDVGVRWLVICSTSTFRSTYLLFEYQRPFMVTRVVVSK